MLLLPHVPPVYLPSAFDNNARFALSQEVLIDHLDIQQAQIRDAIRSLFQKTGYSYQISPEVIGVLSVELKNVPFQQALKMIVEKVGAAFSVENGIYNIFNAKAVQKEPAPIDEDDGFLVLRHTEIRQAIRLIFSRGIPYNFDLMTRRREVHMDDSSYVVSSKVSGYVDGRFANVEPLAAVKVVCSLVGATIERRGEVLVILPFTATQSIKHNRR